MLPRPAVGLHSSKLLLQGPLGSSTHRLGYLNRFSGSSSKAAQHAVRGTPNQASCSPNATSSSRGSCRADVAVACVPPAAAAAYVVSAAVDSTTSDDPQQLQDAGSRDISNQQQQQQQEGPGVLPEHHHVTHLVHLSVQDFALVSHSSISLHPGLTAISGSSGAGKSALIEALSLLLGAPPPGDCVRPPAAAAVIEGTWWLGPHEVAAVRQLLLQAGLPNKAMPAAAAAGGDAGGAAEGSSAAASMAAAGSSAGSNGGGWLHLRREVSRNRAASSGSSSSSRSRVLINGVASSLRVVRVLGELLVDMNGQAASAALRDNKQQLMMLDRVAGVTSTRLALSAAVSKLSALEQQLSQVDALGDDDDRAALQRRIDIINRAGLKPGEDVLLRRRLSALEARRGCLETAAALQAALRGDGSSGGSRTAAAAGSSLLEGLSLVMLQLRGLLSTEEQQQRLLLAERRRLRAGSNGSSRAAVQRGKGLSSGEYEEETVDEHHGELQHAGEGDVEDEEVDDDDNIADDADDDAEVMSSVAGVSALRNALEELEAVEEGLREAQGQLSSYASAVDYSAAEASALSTRLELISKLCRRFRCNRGASGLLQLKQQWSDQLEQYYAAQGQAEAWRVEASELQGHITQPALQLSAARAAAAGRLAAAVQAQLGELVMGSSRFAVRLDWTAAEPSQEPCAQVVSAPTAARPPMEPLGAQHNVTLQQQQQQPMQAADDHIYSSSSSSQDAAATVAQGSSQMPTAAAPSEQQLFRLSSTGLDAVTFLLAAGPSEPLRPLADVASGGEAARIMLALKAAAAAVAADSIAAAGSSGDGSVSSSDAAIGTATAAAAGVSPPPVLVLDELDAGVGSRLGAPVGRLLQRLVGGGQPTASQVLVVTHTPQVAACATQHIIAAKGPGADGRITSSFRALQGTEERLAELADMMGLMGPTAAAAAAQQQQQQQGQQWGQSEEVQRARQLAAQLLAAAQGVEGGNEAQNPPRGERLGGDGAGGNGGNSSSNSSSNSSGLVWDGSSENTSSSGSSGLLMGLSAAAAAAGAAAERPAQAAPPTAPDGSDDQQQQQQQQQCHQQ